MSRGPRKAPSLLEQVRSFKQYVVETLNGFSPDMREMILAEINEAAAASAPAVEGTEEKGEKAPKQKRTKAGVARKPKHAEVLEGTSEPAAEA